MRPLPFLVCVAIPLVVQEAQANVINVSPADGNTAYTKIEGAKAGDEVVIAPGTYKFRVYLQGQGSASEPIFIHAQDPANPPVWDLSGTDVESAPGSYTAGDRGRGCWQVSGGTNYHIDGIVFENCHESDNDSAGMRYYAGTTGLILTNCLFKNNDNGLTGGTENSDITVEFCEFAQNGNTNASTSAPTHNAYIYGGTFTMRYSYLHDPVQAENLHCRAVTSTIEYNWFDRAKGYVGDLMTSDDYANNPSGSLTQRMTLRGNVIIETSSQANTSQIWAMYNDEASGSPVSFSITALYNTVVGAGGHAAFIHLSNADGSQMSVEADDNIISGTSQPFLIEDSAHATLTGQRNWIPTGATGTAGLSATIAGASPGYRDAGSQDFTLAPGSACIAMADTSVSGLPTDDYYENEVVTRMYRVRASAMDLGAFEHSTVGAGIGPYGPGDGGAPGVQDSGLGDAEEAGMTSAVDASVGEDATAPVDAGVGIEKDAAVQAVPDAALNAADGGAASPKNSGSGGCGCRVASVAAPLDFVWVAAFAAAVCGLGVRRTRRRSGA